MGGQLRTDKDLGKIIPDAGNALKRICFNNTTWFTIKIGSMPDEVNVIMEAGDCVLEW
jgi:hypothetical protein